MFKKQRRNFSALATFLGYDGGNPVIRLLRPIRNLKQILVIPLAYTKLVALDESTIPQKYNDLL
jgi:hypothetical protein